MKVNNFIFVAISLIALAMFVMPATAYVDCWSERCDHYIYPSYSYGAPGTSTTTSGSSSYGSQSSYSESPGYTRYPVTSYDDTSRARTTNSNHDYTINDYDYRGPMYERRTDYKETFYKDNSGRSGFFYSKHNDKLVHRIVASTSEKYVGATESMHSTSQNQRSASTDVQQDIHYDRDEGFTYGKMRTFDASEYGRDSYTDKYYYRPNYNSRQGYYDWRY